MLPISPSSPSTRAPSIVSMRTIWATGSACGSSARILPTRAASRASTSMSMLLFEAVQSVPSPIGTRPTSRASGRVRASILRLLAGQWAMAIP